jgi:hypothetical protein
VRRIALPLLVIVAACREGAHDRPPPAPAPPSLKGQAAPERAPPAPPCLDEAAAARELRELEATIDAARPAGSPPLGASALADASCHKRVYRRGNYTIVVSRDSGAPYRVRGSFSETAAGAPRATAGCLADAESELRRLVPYADSILREAREAIGERWTDPDLGPLTYLECDASGRAVGGSLATMLHELNHTLASGTCVHEPTLDAQVCFVLPPGLPPRRIARLDRIQIADPSLRRAIEAAHTLYLDRLGDGDIVSLLDEMVAYRISADVYAAELRDPHRSAAAFIDRHVVLLPFVAYLVTRYLVALRERDPALFEQSFGAGAPSNRAALLALLDPNQRSYDGWLRALRAMNGTPVESETHYWTLYLTARKRALAPTRRRPRSHD